VAYPDHPLGYERLARVTANASAPIVCDGALDGQCVYANATVFS